MDGFSDGGAAPAAAPCRVLVVDDEEAIREYLLMGLTYERFDVRTAGCAEEARQAIAAWRPHVMLLDVMLPDADGFSLAAELGGAGPLIIFLTARDEVDDRVRGLELGADDYLVKPFAFRELVARIRRHLRRAQPAADADVLRFGAVAVSRSAHRVTVRGRCVDVSGRAFDLLCCLLQHPGRVLSKGQLLDLVWGHSYYDENVVEVCIRNLRSRLGDDDHRLIQTVRGAGYRLGG